MLLLVLLCVPACNFAQSGPQPPIPAIATSEVAAQRIDTMLRALAAGAAPGAAFQIVLDDAGLTSWLAERYPTWPLTGLQISFTNDILRLYGEQQAGLLSAGLALELLPVIGDDGALTLRLVAAHLGGSRLPWETVEGLAADVTAALNAALAAAPYPYHLTAYSIGPGELRLDGVWLAGAQ